MGVRHGRSQKHRVVSPQEAHSPQMNMWKERHRLEAAAAFDTPQRVDFSHPDFAMMCSQIRIKSRRVFVVLYLYRSLQKLGRTV